VPAPASFHIHSQRSLREVVFRLIDTVMMMVVLRLAIGYSPLLGIDDLLVIGALTLLLHLVASEASGLYRNWRGATASQEVWCVFLGWIYTAPAVLGIGMLTQCSAQITYQSKMIWLFASPVAMSGARILFRTLLCTLRKRGFNTQRYAICGVNKLGMQLVRNVESSPELGMTFAGYFDDRPKSRTVEGLKESNECLCHSGTLDDLAEMARGGEVQTIFITFPMRAEERIRQYLHKLGDTTASVYIVPDFFVFQLLHARWNQIHGMPVVSLFETPIVGIDGVLKRGFDLVVASSLLLLLAVPMAVIALLIKITSPGPVFFRQKRYGLAGEEIHVLKFRSMACCDNGPVVRQATRGDSRVTPLGRFIRKTSIDELPQLFNVILGNMSLVGPRPHAKAHNELYRPLIDGYMLRHKVKPGITGLAQVCGWRGETQTIDKMVGRIECDHRYIREWSLWMDIKILFRTALIVLQHENAY
jgi:undecaprenyl-phosphate glucose phosphotransferase